MENYFVDKSQVKHLYATIQAAEEQTKTASMVT